MRLVCISGFLSLESSWPLIAHWIPKDSGNMMWVRMTAAGTPSGHRCLRHLHYGFRLPDLSGVSKIGIMHTVCSKRNRSFTFKVILPSKTFFIFGISPLEHFSNFNNLPTTVTIVDLPMDHLDWLDIFLYIDYLFTQINILSKEASYHHSECRISICAANRSMY